MKIMEAAAVFTRKITKKTMHAVRIHSYGGPEVLRYEEIERPEPEAGEVLIQVFAAGVNPVDWKVRQGYLKDKHTLPLICGWDLSGVVVGMGPQADRFQHGDEVYSRPDLSRNGAYAEYIVVRESELAFKPKTVNHIHSAAISLASLTAWQALFDTAQLRSGQKVLIHAAAGGVGHFAVQLAKWRGAYVIGTCSAANQDFVRGLGADETIDYQSMRFEEYVRNADVVLDTIGGETQKRSWKVLRKDGILVSIVGPPSKEEAQANGMRQAFVFVQPNSTQLSEIANLVDSGELQVIVENVFSLSQAAKAQELNQAGHTRGKIVLKVV